MKKVIAIFLTLVMILSFAACKKAEPAAAATEAPVAEAPVAEAPAETEAPAAEVYEIALVTDIGTIDDGSFNQGAWEGVKAYADANSLTYKYYQPKEDSVAARLSCIDLAVKGGAKIIVCPGYLFESTLYEAQSMYPDVSFVLLDGEPHTADYATYKTEANVACVLYAEQEAGYLAGYAVGKSGYTKIGFMGGMAVPAVIRYGYGFIQGLEAAAKELGVTEMEIKYQYSGGFIATPEIQATCSTWYQTGTEVIFACGGKVSDSVFAAAEENNGLCVGVDVDQSKDSATVITSAMKGLSASVEYMLKAYYDGTFPGGSTTVLDAKNDGITVPTGDTNKCTGFTVDDYTRIMNAFKDGSLAPKTDKDAESADKLGTEIVKVFIIE